MDARNCVVKNVYFIQISKFDPRNDYEFGF